MISSSYCTGCLESNPGSDLLLWHSPQGLVFVDSVFCLEALHPALAHCMLLVFWFVHHLACLLVCSLVPQIETNDFPELDFQQQGSGLGMHLHYMPKERLQSVPRALQKPPLHPILSFSLLFNKFFKHSQCSFCSCDLAKTWV